MSEISISNTPPAPANIPPAIIEQSATPSTSTTSESSGPVIISALSDAAPTLDMRTSESPMVLSSRAPHMMKI